MPSSSKSRGSGGGPSGLSRTPMTVPMSERQQMALVMQMTSQENPPPNPPEERKRNRQQRNERGETPLHVAAIRGDHEQVKKLLDQGLDPDAPDFAGWTPLHEACSYGWYQVVEVLVKGGANVNAKGLDDDTPLHDASTSGNLKMVRFLVENGADPSIKNSKGKQPADYGGPHIYAYFTSLNESTAKPSNTVRVRDDNNKKSNVSTSNEVKRNMDSLMQGEHIETKEATAAGEVNSSGEPKEDSANQLSSGVVSSSQDDVNSTSAGNKRPFFETDSPDNDVGDDDNAKKKKKKDNESEKESKPAAVARGTAGRILTGTKPPGPASKTGATPLGKTGGAPNANKTAPTASTGKSTVQNQPKNVTTGTTKPMQGQGKSGTNKVGSSTQLKSDRKSPVPSPKPQVKEAEGDEESKSQESSAPKVPPLKIVIPGGACTGNRSGEQEGDGGSGQRGSGKGRNISSTLPYIIPCTTSDTGPASDSSDGNSDDKRPLGDGKGQGQRVLRSHRTTDEKEKDKDGTAPQPAAAGQSTVVSSNKSPPPTTQTQEFEQPSTSTTTTSSTTTSRTDSVELHPRKRKIKASRETHTREPVKTEPPPEPIMHANPYQMYLHIKKQIERRQKSLFPVKPKPPKDFNKYLMNRCTYTLQGNAPAAPSAEPPASLPAPMRDEFLAQEAERHRLKLQHLVEKEKLVLAVEQEILRVHGRAERAVANQSLPYSVCTMLRDTEVYNVLAPEAEEKRNAQRSRCNGRQINSWLQEVDDKWEKIKEGMLKRQHTEAESLHAVQCMSWEWKLKDLGLCDYKQTPTIEAAHVPQIHVSNFDLPA